MRILGKFFLFILIVSIPLLSLLTALNIVLRMPDLYVYEFNNAEITKEINLTMKNDELGKFFSDFMLYKNMEFDLKAEISEREQNIFLKNERQNMENIRSILDKMLVCAGAMFVYMLITYWILLIRKKKSVLRNIFIKCLYLYFLIIALGVIAYNIDYIHEKVYQILFVSPFQEGNILPILLTDNFAKTSLFASAAVASVIMIILVSITWRITKPKRMFG